MKKLCESKPQHDVSTGLQVDRPTKFGCKVRLGHFTIFWGDYSTTNYEVTGTNIGFYSFSWESSANLTGKLVEGTSLCEPVAGTFTETRKTNYRIDRDIYHSHLPIVVTTASKEIDDPYWRVVVERDDTKINEYFARKLEIFHEPDDEESAFFTCDFVDF